MKTQVFSTCAQSADHSPRDFAQRAADVAHWSEAAGCSGMLIYTDNRLVDPWLVAQIALQNTDHLYPLVAVQPAYMHPYAVANMIASLGFLYERRIYLNMVAGGFMNDLTALGDRTPHDRRYERLVEYTSIIKELLLRSIEGKPLSFDGEFYKTEHLKLTPTLPLELMPGIFLSGSSDAGMRAVEALDAVGIQYPRPVDTYDQPLPDGGRFGMRIGIVTRPDSAEAWSIAEDRFPEDRRGQLTHQLAMKVSDSEWHRQLSELGRSESSDNPYWLRPFENYKTMCPYLVGGYERVAMELARYIRLGYESFILDIPPDPEELQHTGHVFERAESIAASAEA